MTSKYSYTLIGAFLLGALTLLVVGILMFSNVGLFQKNRQAVIFFDQSVLGLTKGSHVLFRGMRVGTVRNVQLQLGHDRNDRVAVTIEMSGDDIVMPDGGKLASDLTVSDLVKRGLRAQLVIYSYVTSELAVDLDFKPDTQARYHMSSDQRHDPEIPSLPSELEKIQRKLSNMPWEKNMEQAQEALDSVVKLTKDLDKWLNRMAPDLHKTTQSTDETLKMVRQAIKTNNQQLQATMASVKRLSNTANSQLQRHDKQIDALVANAQHTSKTLEELAHNLNDVADPDSDTRQDLKSIMRDLSATTASMRRFSEQIERNPNAVIYGGSE